MRTRRVVRPLLSFALAASLVACTKEEPSAPTSDAGADAGARGVDPFCRTRPRLSFCEDFDETDLPGRFVGIEGSTAIVQREPSAEAPSAPNVLTIAHALGATDARFVLDAKEGVKYNLFFFVNVQPRHGRVEIAGVDDGAYHLEIGVEEDGRWYVEERAGAVDGGALPAPRTVATQIGPELGTFSSVRLDVYVDGGGLGHMRFRSGDDVVFQSEPLTFGERKSTLTPKIYVGARLRAGAPSRLSFDNVTLGED